MYEPGIIQAEYATLVAVVDEGPLDIVPRSCPDICPEGRKSGDQQRQREGLVVLTSTFPSSAGTAARLMVASLTYGIRVSVASLSSFFGSRYI